MDLDADLNPATVWSEPTILMDLDFILSAYQDLNWI